MQAKPLPPLLKEQVAILYQQNTAMVTVNAIVAGLLIFGLASTVPHPLLIGWGLMMLTVCVIRISFWLMYRMRKNGEFDRFYADLFVFGCALSGVVWASASIMFFQANTIEYQLLMFFVLTGLAAGAVTALYSYPPAFFAYFLTSFIPLTIWLILSGGKLHTTLASFNIVFILGLSMMYLRLNRSLVRSLTLRAVNEDLEQRAQALERKTEQCKESQKRLIELADTNLRPTLHSLNLMSQAVEEDENKEKTQATIKSYLNRLNFKFEALQDIAMLEAGVVQPSMKSFHIQTLTDQLAHTFSPVAAQKGLSMSVESADLIVHSDPIILQNALRYFICQSLRQSVEGEITLACHVENSQVVLEIRNSDKHSAGAGTQLKAEVDVVLGMVNQLAELLGHKTQSNAYPGLGSVYRVYLPFGERESSLQTPPAPQRLNTAPDIAPKTVVAYLERDNVSRQYTAKALTQKGCDVVSGESIEALLSTIQQSQHKPNTIIVDAGYRDSDYALAQINAIREIIGSHPVRCYITTTNKELKIDPNTFPSASIALLKPISAATIESIAYSSGTKLTANAEHSPQFLHPSQMAD